MDEGTSKHSEQLSSSPAKEEINNLQQTISIPDINLKSDNVHSNNSEKSAQRTIASVTSTMNQHSAGHFPDTTISQGQINIQPGTYVSTQLKSKHTYPNAVRNLTSSSVFTPQRTMDASIFNCSNPGSDVLQNQYMQYNSCNPTDGLRTALHCVKGISFSNSFVSHKNITSDTSNQYLFSSPNQDFFNTFPKSPSLSSDCETSNGHPCTVGASPSPLVADDLNLRHDGALFHSASSGQTVDSAKKNSQIPETIFHGLSMNIAPGSAKSLLSPLITRNDQPPLVADVTGIAPATSSKISSTLKRKGSGSENLRQHVSDFVSVDTHVSISHQSFAQSYATLTPWTSKLTAPDYVPLPPPTPDAMPIPLEHSRQEYLLSIPPPSQKISAKSWNSRPRHGYSHIKPNFVLGCNDDNKTNSKTNGYYSGAFHTSRSGFKVMPNKEHRFRKTAEALQKSGLWEVAMKTGNLIKRNRELQKELEEFRSDAVAFLKSVIKNPQNRDFIKNVLNTALTSNTVSRNGSSVMAVVVSTVAAAASNGLDSCGSSDESISGDIST